jgi:DNA-binding beta-propeller fold protein YncE
MRMIGIAAAMVSAVTLVAATPPATAQSSIVQRIPGPDAGWDLLSVDTVRRRLLVARTDGVMVVDLDSGQVTPHFVAGARLHSVFAIPGSKLGIATSGQANKAILFDIETGVVTAEIPTGTNPDAAIYEPASRTVWVMNARDGTATVIDPFHAKVVATVPIGGALEMPALDGHGHLFVNVEDKNEIAEVTLANRLVLRHIPLTGCVGPTGLTFVSSGILISACANGVAKLVRASDGGVAGEFPIGPRPDGAFVDERHHRAYIPSGGDGTLTVIDTHGRFPRPVAKLSTQAGARTGAVDPASGKVYLPAARYTPPPAGGGRPGLVPGSFEILVVSTAG